VFDLKLSIDGNKRGSIKLAKFGREKIPNLKRGIDRGTSRLERTIKEKKLSGQVLNVRTGLLRSSWHTTPARYQPGVGVSGQVGTNVKYARVHEYGMVIKAKNFPFMRFRTADGAWHMVKQVTIPARPSAGPAMREDRDAIASDIIAEMMRPLK
jgi:phage gpG-like protein